MVKPFAAISVLVCLATILSCVTLERKRPHHRADRFLIGFLGLLAIYQAMRILHSAGIVTLSVGARFDDVIELVVTLFYFLAAGLLRLSSLDHLDAESAMRLVRAAPPRSQLRNPDPALELARREVSAVETLNWALPRLSDGAFRLYAYLCLRQDQPSGQASFSAGDVRLKLGKSKDEVDGHLAELESAGAVTINREGSSVGIEIVPPARPSATANVAEFTHPARAISG